MKHLTLLLAITLITSFLDSCQNAPTKSTSSTQRYDEAEVQVIDLLSLVEDENKNIFAELIAYSGQDESRYLKTHLNLSTGIEKNQNDKYFESLKNIMTECYTAYPSTGDIDTDFTFIVNGSKKETINDIDVIRVSMIFCDPDEQNCSDKTYYFDFVMGEKEYLLLDINQLKLFKK